MLLMLILVVLTVLSVELTEAKVEPHKTEFCHNGHTIETDHHAWPAHKAHGDTLGPCPLPPSSTSPTIPSILVPEPACQGGDMLVQSRGKWFYCPNYTASSSTQRDAPSQLPSTGRR